jgi:hypothetical protein
MRDAASRWYRTAIPRAEQFYDDYLAELDEVVPRLE